MNALIRRMAGILLIPVTFAGCAPTRRAVAAAPEHHPLVVFLVRHAEKADGNRDPELTPAGRERAVALANTLRGAEVEYVHSSDFIRTRETAAPTATEYGLTVDLYDPGDLPTLLEQVTSAGGRHLIVGHSNTTPAMVALLGGAPGPPIDEASEYDRLYMVTIGRDGAASSVMIRYGRPSEPGPFARDPAFSVPECDGAETTAGMRRCLNQARERLVGEMERVFRSTRARANQPATLDSAQTVWVAFRQAQCVAASDQFDGGSLQPVVFLSCWIEVTQERLRSLERLFRDP